MRYLKVLAHILQRLSQRTYASVHSLQLQKAGQQFRRFWLDYHRQALSRLLGRLGPQLVRG